MMENTENEANGNQGKAHMTGLAQDLRPRFTDKPIVAFADVVFEVAQAE
jgi:hypothetical protein